MLTIAGGIIIAVVILTFLPLLFTKGFWIFISIVGAIFFLFVVWAVNIRSPVQKTISPIVQPVNYNSCTTPPNTVFWEGKCESVDYFTTH